MLVRAAHSGDSEACAAIYAPFVTDSWVSFEAAPPDAQEMAQRIADYSASHAWLVAETDGKIAGFAYGSQHRSRMAYASSCDVTVYAAPEYARQGVGRALYAELLPQLARKYHAAFAGIALPNPASVALHEAAGFTLVGIYREVGFKLGEWRDVGWWQRLL
ncbi:MAG: arsinothricin resistance N-acetyltransferase ArsN1 family B [Pontixanthobacter sp.]